jgi:hypothetical protein
VNTRLADEMRSRLNLAPGELESDEELLACFKGSLFEAGCLITLAGRDFATEIAAAMPRLAAAFRSLKA